MESKANERSKSANPLITIIGGGRTKTLADGTIITLPPDSVEVELLFTVEDAGTGTKYDKLTLRRPTVRERLLNAKAGGLNEVREIAFLSAISNVPVEAFDRMDLSDLGHLKEATGEFDFFPPNPSGK